MTEILSPPAFKAEVQLLVVELAKLVYEYEYAHGAAFSPQVVDTASVTSDHSNVPHSLAGQRSKLKGQLRDACEMLRRFRMGKRRPNGSWQHVGVEQQVDWITAALEGAETRHGVAFDLTRNPRSLAADGSELRELLDAQRRRRRRGETA